MAGRLPLTQLAGRLRSRRSPLQDAPDTSHTGTTQAASSHAVDGVAVNADSGTENSSRAASYYPGASSAYRPQDGSLPSSSSRQLHPYMMLGDDDVARLVAAPHRQHAPQFDSARSAGRFMNDHTTDPDAHSSRSQRIRSRLSTRELQFAAESGARRASEFVEDAASKAAQFTAPIRTGVVQSAKRMSQKWQPQKPFLSAFQGRRAPGEDGGHCFRPQLMRPRFGQRHQRRDFGNQNSSNDSSLDRNMSATRSDSNHASVTMYATNDGYVDNDFYEDGLERDTSDGNKGANAYDNGDGSDKNGDRRSRNSVDRTSSKSIRPVSSDPAHAVRVVHINQPGQNQGRFPSNYVSTTKYSPLNAVPKFLFEQFTRFSNTYFLFIGILYCIDAISPIFTSGRYSSLWVLAIVVSISGIKEAVEDWRRLRQDRRVNRAQTRILGSSSSKKDLWASVKVGDILKVSGKETFPADMILLSSSDKDGLAFVETKQLDGESNLKVKLVPPQLGDAFSTEAKALLVRGFVESELPNDRLYKYSGAMTLDSVPTSSQSSQDAPLARSLSSPSAKSAGAMQVMPSASSPQSSSAKNSDPFDLDDSAGSPTVQSHDRVSFVPPSPSTASSIALPATSREAALHTKIPLGPENLVIRGSSLRNTEWILGLVINTGRDTKLMQNVKPRPRKNSRLERSTNKHFFVSLGLQICIVTALTIRSSQYCDRLFGSSFAWYLYADENCSPRNKFLRFFTFFATFSSFIPISLYVSMEIVRGIQMYFIERDLRMKDPVTGVHAEARTTNLNEELGVVHYVFTDKTGTLTANRMEFKKCSLADRVYTWSKQVEPGTHRLEDLAMAVHGGINSSASAMFTPRDLEVGELGMKLLAICHSVVAETRRPPEGTDRAQSRDSTGGSSTGSRENTGLSEVDKLTSSQTQSNLRDQQIDAGSNQSDDSAQLLNGQGHAVSSDGASPDVVYQASSPDEAALVSAARSHGFKFVSRSNREVVIDVNGRLEEYELLEVLEFDSTRKRMSVIVRCPDDRVVLFAKGADSVIFERLRSDQDPAVTAQHLHDFAVEGLRTLCLAYSVLDVSVYKQWKARYAEASCQVVNREEAIARVADDIECNLTLLGATAIEDKLQEGVPETLRKLEQANVRVWILTGDKQETAINIGLSCGAIEDGMDVYIINENSLEDVAAQIDCAIGRWKALLHDPAMEKKLGLVVDGKTLYFALQPELQNKMMHLTRMARSVIACRVSPKQKTELVEFVRRHEKGKVTLAIGDGANDVGMIQAAHVGVGIVGLEGQEAKLASDYSIGQFRFLARLMFVHGRWNYKRLSKMVLYTVYKNMTMTLCEMYWATLSAYTGQPLLDPWMAGIYNLFSSSIPPILLGSLDQELSAEYALAFPEIYAKGQRNTAFNIRVFLSWLLSALWQSAVIFYMVYWAMADRPQSSGREMGFWSFGTVIFTLVILVVHCYALLYQSALTRLTGSLYFVSFCSWYVLAPLFSTEAVSLSSDFAPGMFQVTHLVFRDPRTWMLSFLVPVMCVTPALLWKYLKRQRRPNVKMLVQELMRSGFTRDDITGVLESKPLRRVPSYDPSGASTPVGPATFVKGERQYAFSGFNFDGDESVTVLVHRHVFANSRGVRRKRMRVLKRAGSDTELDVAGVHTAQQSPLSPALSPSEVPPFDIGAQRKERYRRTRRQDVKFDVPDQADIEVTAPLNSASTKATASHRRALSDGAVLVEDRYERLSNTMQGDLEPR